jgi:hypothetical protein
MYTVLFYILKPQYFKKMTNLKKNRLNSNALSINMTEFDLKMLIQDEPNESGLCTPYSIVKCTNTLSWPK